MRKFASIKSMKTRRKFIKKFIQSNALLMFSTTGLFKSLGDTLFQDTLVDNPYASVDWKRVRHVPSASHVHVPDKSEFDKAYGQMKLRHIPISNYYPSAPYYPLNTIREGQFRVRQDFGTMYNPEQLKGRERWIKGKMMAGPLEWNKIIMDEEPGWHDDLPEELKKEMPFTVGDLAFPNIPSDVIISPNAEHHTFTNSSLHANSLGSLYSSGSFDNKNRFLTTDHGYCRGTGKPWQVVFKEMLDQLVFPDGGGITVNHPVWSVLPFNQVCEMLDFDDRVLGIEVYNDTCEISTGRPKNGWSIDLWDQLLATGRRCLGLFVPDHTMRKGRVFLLVPEFTEHACLKAYRQGAFYGAMLGTGLGFTNITLNKNKLKVAVNKQANIRFVTNSGKDQKENATGAEFSIPVDGRKRPSIKYVRVEAEDGTGERIFSQAIRFT